MPHTTVPTPPLSEVYDIAVIGGGINGVGIAADASGRGLSVFLCEKDDLASHTSSASSKLIHGGLRYLEHYEFRLVREALAEREVLLAKAPHIVKPMRFVLPHRPHLRPAWMIRAGMFLYDNLGKREKLPASRTIRFGADSPLNSSITRGFEYSDCWVDDARLVVLNAMAARENARTSIRKPAVSVPVVSKACGTCTWNAATAACFRSMPRHWSMRQDRGWRSSSVKTSSSIRLTAFA